MTTLPPNCFIGQWGTPRSRGPAIPKVCAECGTPFTAKPMAYNALYCTDTCKRRQQRARLKIFNPNQRTQARARSYIKTKEYPDRYEAHLRNCRNSQKALRSWKQEYKMLRGCIDCGYKAHFSALDLDHEGPKSVSIGNCQSIKRLLAEIEAGRCVVRCANCHRIKTWKERQNAQA